VSAPALEPTTLPSPRLGWLLLFFIVAFLVVTQFVGYMSRGTSPDAAARKAETELRLSMSQKAVAERLRSIVDSREVVKTAQLREGLLHDLRSDIPRSEYAAAVAAAIAVERGERVPEAALEKLSKSKKPRVQALLETYRANSLTPQEAQALVDRLPDAPFVYKAAKIHALEKAGQKGVRAEFFPRALLLPFLVLAFVAVVLGGLALWIAYGFARNLGKLKPLGHPTGELSPDNADRYAMRASQILLLFFSIGIVFALVFSARQDRWIMPLQMAIVLGLVLLLARVPIYGKKISPRLQGLHTENLGVNVLWGLAGAVANVPLLILTVLVTAPLFSGLPAPEHPSTTELMASRSVLLILSTFFAASVVAPIIEEICFRGTLFPALASVTRSVPAGVVLSSLIFAAIHPTGLPAWAPLAAIGATAAMLTHQTKSLVPAMVMHAVHNSAILIFTLIAF